MSKQENTRTKFIDKDGITRDFERWTCKRISTAKEKTIQLYQQLGQWAIKDLLKSGVVVVSFGMVDSNLDYTEQERMSFNDFVQIVEAGRI
jgi:hypothetical protein